MPFSHRTVVLAVLAGALVLLTSPAESRYDYGSCPNGNMDAGCRYKEQDDWLFLVLVETWPGSFCSDGCCRTPTNVARISDGFTLHGLWPNYAGGKYPACCSSPFTESQVSTMIARNDQLEKDLATYWPSLKKCDFVQYEWNKHGTCAATVFNNSATGPIDYMRAAVGLRKRWDFAQALQAAGIVPSNSRKYKPQTEILPAIARVTGTAVCLACKDNALAEIRVCIQRPEGAAPGDMQPYDCPSDFLKANANCNSGGISIPPIPNIPGGSECQI